MSTISRSFVSSALVSLLSTLAIFQFPATAQDDANQSLEQQEERLAEQIDELATSGKASQAIPLARKALDIARKISPSNPAAVTAAMDRLATVLASHGEFGEAKTLYGQAMALDEQDKGKDDPLIARYLAKLGLVSQWQHDYSAAEPFYRRALAIDQKSLSANDPLIAEDWSNLANVMDAQAKNNEALECYDRALQLTEAAKGAESIEIATLLKDKATVLGNQNKYEEAAQLLQQAIGIRQKALGEQDETVIESLNNLAGMYIRQQRFQEAMPLLARALKGYEKSGAAAMVQQAHALNNLGYAELALKQTREAEQHFIQAARLLDQYFMQVLPGLSFGEQREFINNEVPGETTLLLSACRSPEALPAAYDLFMRWKGLLIAYLKLTGEATRDTKDPMLAQSIAQLQSIRSQLAESYFHYLSVKTDKCAEWKNNYEQLTAQKEAAERDLAIQINNDGRKSVTLGSLDLAQLKKSLVNDSVLVDIYLYNYTGEDLETGYRYGAVVTSSSGPQLVDLGPAAALDKALDTWRYDAIHSAKRTPESWKVLKDLVWNPLTKRLPQNIKTLWICPDGELSRIPWHLLPEKADEQSIKAEVCQTDSPRELINLLDCDSRQDSSAASGLLVVSGIDFNADISDTPGSPPPRQGNGLLTLHALPGTDDEARLIEELAQKKNLTVTELTGAQATKAAVVKDLQKATYAHLATHGFFFDESLIPELKNTNPTAESQPLPTRAVEVVKAYARARTANRNPLVESGIALAGANNFGSAKNSRSGLLTAEELIGLNLSGCKLLTLSACETGRGKEVVGQGVLGLRASLMAAGAHSILMSLWRVPDASTAELMTAFYTNLWIKGLPPVVALKEAQNTVKSAAEHRFEDPVNWAGWVIIGK